MIELFAVFILGAVTGALIASAWKLDGEPRVDPSEHGRNPL